MSGKHEIPRLPVEALRRLGIQRLKFTCSGDFVFALPIDQFRGHDMVTAFVGITCPHCGAQPFKAVPDWQIAVED